MPSIEGVDTITIASPERKLTATFAPGAGMVCCSLRHEGQELLAQCAGLRAYAERGSTMGIPLLHPWANRLAASTYGAPPRLVELDEASPLVRRDQNGLPIHGVIASRLPWRILDGAPRDSQLRAQMQWESLDLLAVFPFPHRLELRASLEGSALRVDTIMRATSELPVPVSFGHHPYLTLPGVDRRRWRVELPVMRRLALDGRGIPTGVVELVDQPAFELADSSWDDAFDGVADDAVFSVSGGGRRVALEFLHGYPCAQVFAPSPEAFICFEPMTAPTNALVSGHGLRTVSPGDEFHAAFRVSVSAER